MQVVVAAADSGPVEQQQVVVLQGEAAEAISPEILQSIAHSDTVYYVQPDGSLVAGGTLAETAQEKVSTPVNMSGGGAAAAHVVQVKPPTSQVQQYVVKTVQMVSRPPPAKPQPQDPNANEEAESPDEHGCCVAHRKDEPRRKKAAKIKTRSGRISRPPKHKAKDYKFLKVGDSIQDSSGDSSDYSELSSEEEGGGGTGGKGAVLLGKRPMAYAVKNSLFQCQKCEKSYMGKGGLFRHYRLYPAHGQMDPSFVLEARKNGDGEVKKPIPRPRKRLLEDPPAPDGSSQPNLATDVREMMPTARGGRRHMPGRFGRPRKIIRNGSVEERASSPKELIQQCDEKDLKEHVAPSVAKLLSVYEFMLLKVKPDQPDKPLFPRVYREFEKLHAAVRALAEEYVINMDQNTAKPLEVADNKVAESLGISKDMTVKATPAAAVTVKRERPAKEAQEEVAESPAVSQDLTLKRTPSLTDGRNRDESSDVELMPPSKRLKVDEDQSRERVAGDAAQDVGEDPHSNGTLVPHEAAVLGTDRTNDTEPGTVGSESVTAPEILQGQGEAAESESLPSPHSSDASQSHDRPLNLSRHPTEEAQSFQTYITHSDAQETAEPDLPQSCDQQTAEPAPHCDESLSSIAIDDSQISDPTRTFVTTSVPTALVEAASRDSAQVSFVEVGGTLIPTTTAFSGGGLNVGEAATAFNLNHGHEYVFIHSTEGASAEETVVIFDSAEAAQTHLDTVMALVEM
ncbi:zinc finger protein 839 [Gastrophryne carolinensis]